MADQMTTLRPRKTAGGEPDAVTGDGRIYRALHDAILEQRLPPGTKLTEDGLGEIFGVSRTVVRKSLLRLAHENLVVIRPNRGAVVASPSVDEAADVFEARRIIEGAIVRKVCQRMTVQQVSRLRALVDRERAAHESGDRSGWIRLSGAFHLAIAEMAGNQVLGDHLQELVLRTSLIISLYERPGNSACSFDDHSALVDALASGKVDRALTLMDRHLVDCEEKLDIEAERPSQDLAQIFSGRG